MTDSHSGVVETTRLVADGTVDPGRRQGPSIARGAADRRRDARSRRRAQAMTLFAEASPSRVPRIWTSVGYLAAFGLLSAVSLLRQPGVGAWNTVWAEDGSIFYQGTFHHSTLGSLTTNFSGYDELLPRLLENVVRFLPLRDLAPFAAIVGAMCLSISALVVFHAARGHLRTLYGRVLLVAAMVLLPIAGTELLNNLVNVPWWLFFASFWALIWRPQTSAGRIVAGLVCFLAVSSEPIVALLLPLALLRLVSLRSMDENAPTAGFFAGLLFQVVTMTFGGTQPSLHAQAYAPALHGLPQDFLLRVGLGWLTGSRLTTRFILDGPGLGMAISAMVLLALILLAISARDRRATGFSIMAMALAIVTFVVPVWLRGAAPPAMTMGADVFARWAAVPILLLISALLVAMEGRLRREATGRTLLSVSLAVILLPAWLVDFRDANGRTHGPAWSAQVAAAKSRCERHVPRGGLVTLHISPTGWDVTVPCDKL